MRELNPIHIRILGALWYLGGEGTMPADLDFLLILNHLLKVDDMKTKI